MYAQDIFFQKNELEHKNFYVVLRVKFYEIIRTLKKINIAFHISLNYASNVI